MKLTPKAKKARERLSAMKDAQISNPPNRKARRDLEKLFKDACFDANVLEDQRKVWDKNKKTPTMKEV